MDLYWQILAQDNFNLVNFKMMTQNLNLKQQFIEIDLWKYDLSLYYQIITSKLFPISQLSTNIIKGVPTKPSFVQYHNEMYNNNEFMMDQLNKCFEDKIPEEIEKLSKD